MVSARSTSFQRRSISPQIRCHPSLQQTPWCLNLDEVLKVERCDDLAGVVLVRAHDQHAPWITAYGAEHVGGEAIGSVEEATAAVKAMVKGISLLPVLNQGLIDSRERSAAVQALTYFHQHGHRLDPRQLIIEALRNGWPGDSPLELADLARDVAAGKRMRQQQRLRPEVVTEWAYTVDPERIQTAACLGTPHGPELLPIDPSARLA